MCACVCVCVVLSLSLFLSLSVCVCVCVRACVLVWSLAIGVYTNHRDGKADHKTGFHPDCVPRQYWPYVQSAIYIPLV